MLHAEKGEGLVDLVMSHGRGLQLTWSWFGLPGYIALAAHARERLKRRE
jgi:hypothetical protein